ASRSRSQTTAPGCRPGSRSAPGIHSSPPSPRARGSACSSPSAWRAPPAASCGSPRRKVTAPPARCGCRGGRPDMRALEGDDEVRNAELTALELRDAGHEVEFLNGGAAALKRLESGGVEALVTDLRMAP